MNADRFTVYGVGCTLLAAVGVAVLLSRRPAPPEPGETPPALQLVDRGLGIAVLRDDVRHVTCWQDSTSISCLRDPEPCAKPGVVR